MQVKSDADDDDHGTSDNIVVESLHPHATHVQFAGVVHLKGATALRVIVDRRTEVLFVFLYARCIAS